LAQALERDAGGFIGDDDMRALKHRLDVFAPQFKRLQQHDAQEFASALTEALLAELGPACSPDATAQALASGLAELKRGYEETCGTGDLATAVRQLILTRVCARACVCVCVCVCEKERERERETGTPRERETDSDAVPQLHTHTRTHTPTHYTLTRTHTARAHGSCTARSSILWASSAYWSGLA
jgi:hypothetical protein